MRREDIIYMRISKDASKQDESDQLKNIQSIAPEGARIVRERKSAWGYDSLKKRPKFREMYDLIKKGRVKSINVWDTDRIFRNRKRFVEFFRLCDHKNTIVRSFRQDWLQEFENIPNPWGEIVQDLMLQILGWIAEEESKKKSERIIKAYENHDGDDWGRPDLDESVVEQILKLREEGLSYRDIRKNVTYVTKSGKKRRPSLGSISKICKGVQ